MGKSISLIISLLLSILSINAQCWIAHNYDFKNFTDLEKRDLKGKIEIVMFSHFDIKNSFGEISKGNKKCEQEVLFNEDGSVNKITNYESNGGIDDVEIHEYENGEIKLISKSYLSKNKENSPIIYIYLNKLYKSHFKIFTN
jgi:hypothetical protein